MNKQALKDCPELVPEADLNGAALFLTGGTGGENGVIEGDG